MQCPALGTVYKEMEQGPFFSTTRILFMRNSLKLLAVAALVGAFAVPMHASAQWGGPGYGGPGYGGPGYGPG
jgi:hypothetical protein